LTLSRPLGNSPWKNMAVLAQFHEHFRRPPVSYDCPRMTETVKVLGLPIGHFDLIVMDISMPDIDGVEATGKIRADDGLSRETPIVALTAHALEDDILQF
jgi:CheY-like chemotaxis protein